MSDEQGDLELVSISALNQYVFCPRRCALMHVEGIWVDNQHTVIGSLLHDHADEPGYETGEGVTLLRALPLYSGRYGLTGYEQDEKRDFPLFCRSCFNPVNPVYKLPSSSWFMRS